MRVVRLALGASLLIGLAVVACTGGGDGSGDAGASSSSTSSTSSSSSSGSGTSGSSSSSSSGASSSGSPVEDTGYSRDCANDDDCILAYFGNSCSFCAPSNAAIAKSSQAAYQAAVNAAREKCPPTQGGGLCAQPANVSKCGAGKKCELVSCDRTYASDPHTCADAGFKDGK